MRFAIATFQRVFDVAPTRDVIGLERLVAGLTRFVVKPGTATSVERVVGRIESARSAIEAGEHRPGPQWSRLEAARRAAETEGRDPAVAITDAAEQLLKEARAAPKRDLRLWSPALYPPASRRGGEHVEHLSCLVLDYDVGVGVGDASATWEEFFHIVHTTWSHTVTVPKFRLILPLAAPVRPADWRRVYEWAQARTGDAVDPTGKGVGTTFALPAVASADQPRTAFSSPGPLLDARLEGLIDEPAEPPPDGLVPDEPNHFRLPIPGHSTVEGSLDDGVSTDDPWASDGVFPWS
ncbi:MAG: hypothetical protein AAGE94_06695 [Acidobacteriota bacterium]